MTEKLAREILGDKNGNRSAIWPYIKDEILKMELPEEYLPFPGEFLFFEGDYLRYYIDIMERKIPSRKVVDIGCQLGFQSYIFEDFEYTGIDCDRVKKFRDKGNYITGYFEDLDIDLSDKIVISNMSLGYFNNWTNTDDWKIAEKLSKAQWLYIGTTPELLEELKQYYTTVEIFEEGDFPRAFLTR